MRVIGRAVGAAGLGPQHGRAGELRERRGLDLGGDARSERLALRPGLRRARLLSAAPAIAAPPMAKAPSAATAAVVLRTVGSMEAVPPGWLDCFDARPVTRETAGSGLRDAGSRGSAARRWSSPRAPARRRSSGARGAPSRARRRSARGRLPRARLRRRGLDDHEVDRVVTAPSAPQHRAARPRRGERAHDDHAFLATERAPQHEPVPRVRERAPERVRDPAQPRRPRLAHGVAVERARLAGDQRRLAGPGRPATTTTSREPGGSTTPAWRRRLIAASRAVENSLRAADHRAARTHAALIRG